jgi:Mn-dependent DtxR family transcriptional regulator
MTPEPETREYLAAIKRLKDWRKQHWESKLAEEEIPKPAVQTSQKLRPPEYVPMKRYKAYHESPMGRAD